MGPGRRAILHPGQRCAMADDEQSAVGAAPTQPAPAPAPATATALDLATQAKQHGNESVRAGQYQAACAHYGKGLEAIGPTLGTGGDAVGEESATLRLVLLSNRAEALLRLPPGHLGAAAVAAANDCDAALAIDPQHAKTQARLQVLLPYTQPYI